MSIGRVPGTTGIQPSIVDAKGDLIVATAADSVDRLAVGSNNQTLLADSAQTTGVKWGSSPQSLMTATGDLLYASAANTPARLGIGSTDQVLKVSGGVPVWGAVPAASYTWSTWTPASRNDMTIGNGTETARYSQIGNTVFWFYTFVFGSTSSIAGSPAIQLPVATTATWEESYGDALLVDASPSVNYAGAAFYIINDKVQFQGQKADGTWSTINDIGASSPFSWTTNDKIRAYGYYEVV